MTNLLSFLMVAPFWVFFVFQPFYSELYSLRQQTVEIILDAAIEKAAVKGRFEDSDIQEMRDILVQVFHYDSNEVNIAATQTLTNRGDYIEGTISVPSGQLWVMPNLFGDDNPDPQLISAYAKQMSEYLPR